MEYVLYLSLLLIDSIFGFYYYKRLNIAFQLLVQLIFITFLFESLSELLIRVRLINTNFPFYHVLQDIQLLYSGVIYFHLNKSFGGKVWFIIPSTIFLTFVLIGISSIYQPYVEFPTFGSLILSLFIIVHSLFLYFKMMITPSDVPIFKQGTFWLNSANFFFYSVTFLAFGYFTYVQEQNDQTPQWVTFLVKASNFMFYTLYGLSMFYSTQLARHGKH